MNTGLNHLGTPDKGIIFLIVALHCMNGFAWPIVLIPISITLLLKKSARFCSSTSDVMLPMYRHRDCLDKFELLPCPFQMSGWASGVIDLEY